MLSCQWRVTEERNKFPIWRQELKGFELLSDAKYIRHLDSGHCCKAPVWWARSQVHHGGVSFPKCTSTLVAWTCVGPQSHSELEALPSARLMPYSSAFSFLFGCQRDRKNICVPVYSYRHYIPLRENGIWSSKGAAAEIRAQISEAAALSLPALYLSTLKFWNLCLVDISNVDGKCKRRLIYKHRWGFEA